MESPFDLQKEIIDFFTSLPNIHESDNQRALVYSAGLDAQLQNQIPFGKPATQFFLFLMSILTNYGQLSDGRNALEAILEAAKSYVGMDRKAYCDTLIQKVRINILTQNSTKRSLNAVDTIFTNIDRYFYPSGWMGDGEEGERYIQFKRTKNYIKISYSPGEKGWGGIYWQYPENNWGNKPGRNLVNVRKLKFCAKGETGDEFVEFKSGGIFNQRYEDSFEKSMGKIKLSIEWRLYEIDLNSQDLSNVIGAFAWIAAKCDNPKGITFYLSDIGFYIPKTINGVIVIDAT